MKQHPTAVSSPTGDRWQRDRGFSLIELLVVVIIVGILAGIAIPVYLNQRKKAVDASLKSDLKNAALAARALVDEGPFLGDRPELGLNYGFNPVDWGNPSRKSWYPAGPDAYDQIINIFRRQGFGATGQVTAQGWKGNRLFVGGVPEQGAWRLCAWNPAASKAVNRVRAVGWDDQQGGLVNEIDCSTGAWLAITPYYDSDGPNTNWW